MEGKLLHQHIIFFIDGVESDIFQKNFNKKAKTNHYLINGLTYFLMII